MFIDADALAQLLREQGEGEWMRWDGGPAGIPNGTLWARFKPDADGRKVMVGLVLLTDGITSAGLRSIPVGELEKAYANHTAEAADDPAELPPLHRGNLSYDDFLRLLARHYLAHAQRTTRPAAAIVKETGEKSATVHGWIHDARQRGILPEARRGKRARPDVVVRDASGAPIAVLELKHGVDISDAMAQAQIHADALEALDDEP